MNTKCEYCSALLHSDMGEEINYSDKEHTYIQICGSWSNKKQYYLKVGNMYHSINTLSDVKYCPWCGRKLSEDSDEN